MMNKELRAIALHAHFANAQVAEVLEERGDRIVKL
jgi:hypothetical protein